MLTEHEREAAAVASENWPHGVNGSQYFHTMENDDIPNAADDDHSHGSLACHLQKHPEDAESG